MLSRNPGYGGYHAIMLGEKNVTWLLYLILVEFRIEAESVQ